MMSNSSWKDYWPTIITFALLIWYELCVQLSSTFPELLVGPFWLLFLSIDMILQLLISLLPSGPWLAHAHGTIITLPNFAGWLIASIIVSAMVFAINRLLVDRKRSRQPEPPQTSARATALRIGLTVALFLLIVAWFLAAEIY